MDLTLTSEAEQRLEALGVSVLYLFGSRAQGTEGPNSDYDFAVLLKKPVPTNTLPLYNALYDLLTDLLPSTGSDPVLDIVFLQSSGLEIQANVVKYGKVLFDTDTVARLDYEADVMLRMADAQPILRIMDEATLNRI